jgi:hypothetical protein
MRPLRRQPTASRAPALDPFVRWRYDRLVEAGFGATLAERVAGEPGYDLHAVLNLLDRGCPPELAARILAPLDGPGPG